VVTAQVSWTAALRKRPTPLDDAPEADFLVVGAGAAGCALASRLAQRPGVSVVVLEAGRLGGWLTTRMPAGILGMKGNPRYDWLHRSEPDPTRHGQTEVWARGKAVGGSSATNGMVFVRGCAADFNAWESLGARGWGWRDVLPIFRRLERAEDRDSPVRGHHGPMRVSRLPHVHRLTPSFIESCQALGIPFNDDVNGVSQEGVGYAQANIANGRRVDSYTAFVKPRLGRNLRVIEEIEVERLLLEDRSAVGVVATRDGLSYEIRGRAGVILCAGTIGSPRILMLSGLGPARDLSSCGIEPVADLPEVGRNLMEHPGIFADFEVDCATANNQTQPLSAVSNIVRWLLLKSGPAASPAVQALAFFRSSGERREPNLQFQLYPFAGESETRIPRLENRRLMSLSVSLSHPESRGFIRLNSANPGLAPEIHPQLLESQTDVNQLIEGVRWARRVVGTQPFARHVVQPPAISAETADASDLEDFIRRNAVPMYHPAGSCRMGSDPQSVVDPTLRVNGIGRLWIADNSIFPRHISGNLHATALMIGERAADFIGTGPTG
jgi:choline dehydrogenase